MIEAHEKIIRKYIDAYNAFDIDGMTRHLNEGVVFENISAEKLTLKTEGILAFKEQAEKAKTYFSEREQIIDSITFVDQKVRVQISYRALLAIDLPNGMKKGQSFEMKGHSDFVFKGDKIQLIRDVS